MKIIKEWSLGLVMLIVSIIGMGISGMLIAEERKAAPSKMYGDNTDTSIEMQVLDKVTRPGEDVPVSQWFRMVPIADKLDRCKQYCNFLSSWSKQCTFAPITKEECLKLIPEDSTSMNCWAASATFRGTRVNDVIKFKCDRPLPDILNISVFSLGGSSCMIPVNH